MLLAWGAQPFYSQVNKVNFYSERIDFIISSRAKRARSLLTARGLSQLQNSMLHKSINI